MENQQTGLICNGVPGAAEEANEICASLWWMAALVAGV